MNAPLHPPPAVARFFGYDPGQMLRRANEAALRIVEEAGARSARRAIETGAAIMVREPWRICRVVYPMRPTVWPIPGKLATAVLADCCRLIAAQEAQGRAGRWTFDMNRLVALRQAETALIEIITGDQPDAPEAA